MSLTMPRRAFSIIELLVVIGIIAILLGLLLPTLSKARQHSRSLACKARLQNIGSAFQMYLNENDGWYPPAPYSPTFNPDGLPLVSDFLERYVSENRQIWSCPADHKYFSEYGLSYSYYQEPGDRRQRRSTPDNVLDTSGSRP
jgi:prepilin-type N-terminal cleavage/methylation domain-containing protein